MMAAVKDATLNFTRIEGGARLEMLGNGEGIPKPQLPH